MKNKLIQFSLFVLIFNNSYSINVIGNQSGNAIELLNGSDANLVIGNAIGTDSYGYLNLGNSGAGVFVGGNSLANVIGGTSLADGNLIAYNLKGVVIGTGPNDLSVGNSILSNSIYNNTLIGIDLANDGPTPNHAVNPYTGPNNFQNYPLLGAPVITSTGLNVPWTLHSRPDATFILQFFRNQPGDPEAGLLFNQVTVTTDGNGDVSGTVSVAGGVPLNSAITATATYSLTGVANDTSEIGGVIYSVSPICITHPCRN